MQDPEEEDLLDFEVDFDLGDLLRNGSHQKHQTSKVSATSSGGFAAAEVSDFRRSCEEVLEEILPYSRRAKSPSNNPSASAKRLLPVCCEEDDDCAIADVQKRARTTSAEFGLEKDPQLFDFIADMDWDVEPVDFNMQATKPSAETQNFSSLFEPSCTPQVERRSQKLPYMIPGPAGAIQLGLSNSNKSPDDPAELLVSRSSCQADAFDSRGFKSRAWLRALQHFQITEVDPVKYSRRDFTISHIKSNPGVYRIPQLVAIIKTCTPNGCGDAFVTLKDPTGTITGTVHRRLLAETEFGRDIVPEAVILLCMVTVFRPSVRAQFLNITMNNVVQVFRV